LLHRNTIYIYSLVLSETYITHIRLWYYATYCIKCEIFIYVGETDHTLYELQLLNFYLIRSVVLAGISQRMIPDQIMWNIQHD